MRHNCGVIWQSNVGRLVVCAIYRTPVGARAVAVDNERAFDIDLYASGMRYGVIYLSCVRSRPSVALMVGSLLSRNALGGVWL